MAPRFSHHDRDELPTLGGALSDVFEGRQEGLVVRGAFDPERMAALAQRLEAQAGALPWTPQEFPDGRPGQMMVMGMTLTPVSGFDLDFDRYFDVAAEFARALDGIDGGLLEGSTALLAAMAAGAPVTIPTHRRRGDAYAAATVRTLPKGCQIPVHCGNFFLETPGYDDLLPQLDPTGQLSWFVTVRPAEAGGALEVYDLAWGDPDTPLLAGGLYDGQAIQRQREGLKLCPAAGDLLVFDGGRLYHRVTPVEVGPPRITLGGFVAPRRDHTGWHQWS